MDSLLTADYSLLAVDYAQTRIISDECHAHQGIHEQNVLLGGCPTISKVTAYFAGTELATYYLADALQPKYRRAFLIGLGIIEISAIAHNVKIGIRIKLH